MGVLEIAAFIHNVKAIQIDIKNFKKGGMTFNFE